jgi:hypothetical protein
MKEELFGSDAERRKHRLDYRSSIKPEEVFSLGFKFFFPKLEEVLNEIF